MTAEIERSGSDELFALLQKILPQRLLSRGMHALARSRQPVVRNLPFISDGTKPLQP